MTEPLRLQGRDLTETDIGFICQLIADNPDFSRRRLSIALCEAWQWRNARGDLKDMASRSLLVKLHDRGAIMLPARRRIPSNRMAQRQITLVAHDTTPIAASLKALRPLKVVVVRTHSEHEGLYNTLLSTYHYLGYTSAVGENMKYLVFDQHDRPLACLLFGSAAWSCAHRDATIGWDKDTRARNIGFTTNNTRFLVAPWVNCKHLASHILGLVARRVNQDWQSRYGHPVHLLETFVQRDRHRGTCYQAANWQYVGDTQGRSRNDRQRQLQVPVKAIYLYPLVKDYQQRLQRA